jgi:hypothetical protein
MSDDQGDFANKIRRPKTAPPDDADAPDGTRRKKAAVKKSERKTEKLAAKEGRKKGAPPEAVAAPNLDEKSETRAARKAAKAALHESRRAARAANKANRAHDATANDDAAAAPSPEEKARTRAERKAAKAANKANREKDTAADNADAAPGPNPEKAKARAERKAAKAANKANRKVAKAADKAEHGEGDTAVALSPEEKIKARAERKAEKAARKANRKSREGDDAGGAAEEGGRRARRKERKAEGDDSDAGGTDRLHIALRGLNEIAAAKVRARIEAALTTAGVAFDWAEDGRKSALAIYGFEDPPATPEQIDASIGVLAKDRSKFRILVGRTGAPAADGTDPFAAENHAIAMLACALEGGLVDTTSLLRRYGKDRVLQDGQVTEFGADLVTTAILGIAAGGRSSLSAIPRSQMPVPDDLAAARALSVADILAQLTWSGPKTPRLLWTHASKESMEALLNGKVALSEEESLDLTFPIAWPKELSTRPAEMQGLGLEFLSGVLNYWYSKAANRSTEEIAEIDALVKERGVTAGEILARAGRILIDFADAHPLANDAAWEENAVSRRARVFALFVLCCRLAAKRKVKFDEAVFLRVFNELLTMIEVLRSADFYPPGSFDGVQQDSLVMGLGLTLRKTAYAQQLLNDSMARLKTLQLDIGLTADGVWRTGTFSDHCTLISQFKGILGDFSPSDTALLEPAAAAAKKMTVFAEALLKSNGSPPAFDNSRDKSYLKKLAGTRRLLASTGFSKTAPAKGKPMPRITDTYVFRDAQYFASHTTQNPVPDSSLVILYREAGSVARDNPGGIGLAFAYGDTDLLVCTDPEEGTKKRDKDALFDAALRNGYHIHGAGYAPDQEIRPEQARLVKSWRGEGWAAAKSIDETNPAGSVVRTVFHIKKQHALVVIDELKAADGNETAFEQFWHIAPGLALAGNASSLLRFAGAAGGNLTVVFDARGTTASQPEGEDGTATCVRRTFQMAKGVVASMVQWSDAPAPAALKVIGAGDGRWALELSGAGFDGRLSLAGEELRYEPKPAG